LAQGNRTRCKSCDRKSRAGDQPATDLAQWYGLSEKLKARIILAYREHRRVCGTIEMPAVPFAKFMIEFLQDPDSEKDEPLPTFEERLALSNLQRYRQYDRPREMV
jgi:hypothetical protein